MSGKNEDDAWTWIVSVFDKTMTFAAKVDVDLKGKELRKENFPESFRFCKLTHLAFRPPSQANPTPQFAFLPFPVECFGLVGATGTMSRDELTFLWRPTKDLIDRLESTWTPPEESATPAVAAATEADINKAALEARIKQQLVNEMKGGPILLP